MLPLLSLVTLWGVSLCSFLFLIAALAFFKPCRRALALHWPQVRWVAAAFLINFLFAAFCLLTRPEATAGAIEKPVRMLLTICALLLAAFLFARYGQSLGRGRARALLVTSVALVAVTYAIPKSGAQERVAQGVRDVKGWYAGGSAYTNMGIRLELWKGSAALIAERPLLGRDFAGAKQQMALQVGAGTLDPVVLPAVHFHNDALHALVTGGIVGLLAWLAILAAPLVFFARRLRAESGAPALAGMLVVSSYFCFGLTEVIFWSVKASLLYALMVFLLMGLCLNTKENDGN